MWLLHWQPRRSHGVCCETMAAVQVQVQSEQRVAALAAQHPPRQLRLQLQRQRPFLLLSLSLSLLWLLLVLWCLLTQKLAGVMSVRLRWLWAACTGPGRRWQSRHRQRSGVCAWQPGRWAHCPRRRSGVAKRGGAVTM